MRESLEEKVFSGKIFILWKEEFLRNKKLIGISFLLFFLSLFLNYIAGNYTTHHTSVSVSDIFLDHINPINLSFIFVYYYLFIVFFLVVYTLFFKIKKAHIVLVQYSLLISIRSFFIILTHIGDPVGAIPVDFPWIFSGLSFNNDLFFSGHTAIPFLGVFLFKNKKIKYFFFLSAIFLGLTVLLMHQHYTIDVVSAFFITYGSYKIGNFLISKVKSN